MIGAITLLSGPCDTPGPDLNAVPTATVLEPDCRGWILTNPAVTFLRREAKPIMPPTCGISDLLQIKRAELSRA